ncbi:hypothetical protein SAY86_022136 [Trapa natans]|uniref:Uncharacterized protein n=1 Tax=Trapa natans TaxID=22666 RepID=A0AAN7RDJ3_TRANT|nr:hypothetical protein SAY86_022136 [Trapa natans]
MASANRFLAAALLSMVVVASLPDGCRRLMWPDDGVAGSMLSIRLGHRQRHAASLLRLLEERFMATGGRTSGKQATGRCNGSGNHHGCTWAAPRLSLGILATQWPTAPAG